VNAWIAGARPRTLGAGVVPVLVGAAAADRFIAWRFGAAIVVALGLQIGVNYANDYFDGVRGVDTPERIGPPRLVASGAAPARAVLGAALAAIVVASVAGLALAVASAPIPILGIGALALAATLLYSGGPRPFAGLGLGELMVFLFFGLFATCGTAFVLGGSVSADAWWAGVVLGLLAVAILLANNLRDIPTDAATGKRTLAVRLGAGRTRLAYRGCVVGAFGAVAIGTVIHARWPDAGLSPWALLGLVAWILEIRPMELVGSARGRDLIPALTGTAAVHAACGALIALGLVLERMVGPFHVRIGA
jgi:1,4-dihydroxy-2-naphthoate octaprenyltransferase